MSVRKDLLLLGLAGLSVIAAAGLFYVGYVRGEALEYSVVFEPPFVIQNQNGYDWRRVEVEIKGPLPTQKDVFHPVTRSYVAERSELQSGAVWPIDAKALRYRPRTFWSISVTAETPSGRRREVKKIQIP